MDLNEIEFRKNFSSLLFSQPTYFDIKYKINPYMSLDTEVKNTRHNWLDTIRKTREYNNVQTVDYETFKPSDKHISELPDAVFCANHAMPTPEGKFILSNMKNEERKGEIYYFEKWANHNNYPIERINEDINFEGSGDAKWHPKKNLVWVGHGPRTDCRAVSEIDDKINGEVIGLELNSPLYYHLDVCFTPLDKDTVIVVPEAFSSESYQKISDVFETVLHIPNEDKKTMGGNCSLIADNTVMIDKMNLRTIKVLNNNGYTVVEVDTKEFQKSGGSADCLYLKLP